MRFGRRQLMTEGQQATVDQAIRHSALQQAENYAAKVDEVLSNHLKAPNPVAFEAAQLLAGIAIAFTKTATDPGGIR